MAIFYCMGCFRERPEDEDICPVCGCHHAEETVDSDALQPGTTLRGGRYIVGKVLKGGRGSSSLTYIGFDRALETKIVIKENYSSYPAAKRNPISQEGERYVLLREARMQAKADLIPGVIPVRDVFYENNAAYLAASFVEGITLQRILSKVRLMDPGSCLDLLSPVFRTLEMLHTRNIIHCDLHPGNIIFDKDGMVWLLDFGYARPAGKSDGDRHFHFRHLDHRAPEVDSGESIVGPWTDVYSLCQMIRDCTAGSLFGGDEQARAEFYSVLKRGSSENIGDRYDRIYVLADALYQALGKKFAADNRVPAADIPDVIERISSAQSSAETGCSFLFTGDDNAILEKPLRYELYGRMYDSDTDGYDCRLEGVKVGMVYSVFPHGSAGADLDNYEICWSSEKLLDYKFDLLSGKIQKDQPLEIDVAFESDDHAGKYTLSDGTLRIYQNNSCINVEKREDSWLFYKEGLHAATLKSFHNHTCSWEEEAAEGNKAYELLVYRTLNRLETMMLISFTEIVSLIYITSDPD